MVDRFAGRTIHGAPPHARNMAANPILRVEGDVERILNLTPGELSALERRSFLDHLPPEGLDHWPATNWSGIPLSILIQPAAPLADARWIQVLGGPLATVIPIEHADATLLCDRLDGAPIPLEKGGPYRLVSAVLPYNLCVKWVDRIVIAIEEPDRSVERVAQARQRARDARGIS